MHKFQDTRDRKRVGIGDLVVSVNPNLRCRYGIGIVVDLMEDPTEVISEAKDFEFSKEEDDLIRALKGTKMFLVLWSKDTYDKSGSRPSPLWVFSEEIEQYKDEG